MVGCLLEKKDYFDIFYYAIILNTSKCLRPKKK